MRPIWELRVLSESERAYVWDVQQMRRPQGVLPSWGPVARSMQSWLQAHIQGTDRFEEGALRWQEEGEDEGEEEERQEEDERENGKDEFQEARQEEGQESTMSTFLIS